MVNTTTIIDALAREAKPKRLWPQPIKLVGRLAAVLIIYGLAIGAVLGLRTDLLTQFNRPFYITEILLLLTMAVSGLIAAVKLAYPDYNYRSLYIYLPGMCFVLLATLIGVQFFFPDDPRHVLPIAVPGGPAVHAMECAICIAETAVIPAIIMLILLRRGASVRPWLAGFYAVLAAASIGCLMLRLAEGNDDLMHLVQWHYVPTFLFAIIGGMIGKIFLKW